MSHRLSLVSVFLGALIATTASGADSRLDEIDSAIAAANYEVALNLIEDGLAVEPGDTSLQMRRARVNGYNGDDAAALRDLDALRREHPYDVDYALARAQVFVRQGKDKLAIEDLRQGVILAPDYEEPWRLLYELLARSPDEAVRSEYDSVSREAVLRFPNAEWWQRPEPAETESWTVIFGAGHESLDNDLPSWNRQFVEIIRDCDAWGRYRAGVARDERFENADTSFLLGGDTCLDSEWTAGLEITLVGDAQFQPDLSYSAYAGRSFQSGWELKLRYRRREYETATVGSAIGTIEKYVGDFRIAYALGLTHLHGASDSTSHGLTVNWYYSDISSIGLSFNTGEEAESIGPGQVLTMDVRGVALVGRREFSDRLALQWWLGTHDQGDFYRRQYLGMALTIRL